MFTITDVHFEYRFLGGGTKLIAFYIHNGKIMRACRTDSNVWVVLDGSGGYPPVGVQEALNKAALKLKGGTK